MCALHFKQGAVASLLAALCLTSLAVAQTPEIVRIDLGGGQTLEAVRIEPGSFQQGSPLSEAGRGADETQREVTLTRAFLLGKYPVTRGQFARFVAETRYRTEAEVGASGGFGWDGAKLTQRKDFTWNNPGFAQTDAHPVTMVTFKDAEAFARWLSGKSRRTFTLPSEAQWEYAARSGGAPATDAWHKDNSGNSTHPVGELTVNAWGLGDMAGNVWEWCADWYGPYGAADASDPIQRNANLSDKPRRVLRGGSWLREPKFCRPAARYRNDAMSRNADNGFRVMTFDLEPRAIAPPAAAAELPLNLEAPDVPKPAASTAPPAHAATHSDSGISKTGGSSFEWVFAIPVVGILLAIAIKVIRAIANAAGALPGNNTGGLPGTAGMSGQPLRVRVGEDGFWIVGDGVSAGSQIACRYTVNGNSQTMNVRYEPGAQGQFVFTGSRPSNVSISTSSGGSATSRRIGNAIGMGSQIADDPPFTGHPSAY